MIQLRHLAKLLVALTFVGLAGDVSAKPLKAQESLGQSRADLGFEYLGSPANELSTWGSESNHGPDSEANSAALPGQSGSIAAGQGSPLLGDPGWTAASFESGSGAAAAGPERSFRLLAGLDETSFRDIDEAPQVSLDWFVRQVAEGSAAARSARAAATRSSDDDDLDLGLGLFNSVLALEMDRELAQSVLAHTRDLRLLLGSIDIVQVGGGPGKEAVVRGSTINWVDQAADRSAKSSLSQDELDRIKSENSDETIRSFRDFFVKLIIDSKLILLFGISTLAILMVSLMVTRWVRS